MMAVNFAGCRVLIVEDDYYLAVDAAQAFVEAGAAVLGPCPSERAAMAELSRQRPDAVVLDIDLGSGRSFALAELLRREGIPFLFVTGYDDDVIPLRLRDVVRLEKPIEVSKIVGAVSRLLDGLAPAA